VIAGQAYEVRWVTDSTAGLARHANSDAVGHTDSNIGVIAVRTHDTTPTQERDTLLHEVIHAVLELTYLDGSSDHFKSKDAAERIVSVLSTHLLDTFRRNDGLVGYLVESA
jgi:Zn-dependent peptidase ImmA (M78 family)